MRFYHRWYYFFRSRKSHIDSLNRRAAVEQTLFDVARGKRPMLTQKECWDLALKLGSK